MSVFPKKMYLSDAAEWNDSTGIELSYYESLVIVGQVLLALKHPKNVGPSTDVARSVIGRLAKKIIRRFRADLPADLVREWQKEEILK